MSQKHIIVEPEKGRYHDVLLDCPVIFINTAIYRAWHERLYRIFGTGAATILFEMGRGQGEDAVKILKKKLNNPNSISLGLEHAFYLGWGNFKVSKAQLLKMAVLKSLTIKVENGFIPRAVGDREEAACHFLRGFFVGAYETYTGEKCSCEETKCMAKGDPFCEFQLKKEAK
ncbi:MAG: 4-vinyl reductase [Candidatus Bathyarchaeia archaeon]